MSRRLRTLALVLVLLPACTHRPAKPEPTSGSAPAPEPARRGVYLGDLTWAQAEKTLTADRVVVIPLGAGAKEHGRHLLLSNDRRLAEYFTERVARVEDGVVAPMLEYHYYPAFLDYPGSTSLRLETARDLTVDVVRSLARHGPRRFYVLNTGVSTNKALAPAAAELAKDHILLRYTDLIAAIGPVEKQISQQEGGTHADEIETSLMLYIAPETCDMTKAEKDFHPDHGILTRDPNDAEGTYSPTGAWGDPTLATREKGARVAEALASAIRRDLDDVRRAPLP